MTESCQTEQWTDDDRVIRPIQHQARSHEHLHGDRTETHPDGGEEEHMRNGRSPITSGILVLGTLMAVMSSCGRPGGVVVDAPIELEPTSRTIAPTTPISIVASTVPRESFETSLVAEAFDALMTTRVRCGRRPRDCVIDDLAVPGSELHRELTDLMEKRVSAGIVASSRGSLRYRIESTKIDGDIASITTCLLDDTVLLMEGAVFDDSSVSAITDWTMTLTLDGWRWTSWRATQWTNEEDLCGFGA
ncbi:MAG: hypothetical protein ACO3AT_03215 [Ilumatobacteraceae bacterium]